MRAYSRTERDAVLRVIHGLMRQRHMSLRQLASASGLHRSYLERRFTRELPFTTDDLARLAPTLGVEAYQILGATARLLREEYENRRKEGIG